MFYEYITCNSKLNMTNLSIIIPTKNEEESLIILLEELKKYKEIIGEIIIVDAKSTDKTLEVAKKYNCRKRVLFASRRKWKMKKKQYLLPLI